MTARIKLKILAPAQRELEEIARIHLQLVGPESARKITDRIYAALENLQMHPKLGIVARDKWLAQEGYRTLVCGPYLCFYRPIGGTVFVYHIVDGRTNYPRLLSELKE